ncbi:MAG: hypothetical protein EHM70_21405, partial [Chloroflexota bacterium]
MVVNSIPGIYITAVALVCSTGLLVLLIAGAVLFLRRGSIQDVSRAPSVTAPERPPDAGLEAQVMAYMRQGKKLDAIRVYRQATLAGLKEAKDAVERIEAGAPPHQQESQHVNYPLREDWRPEVESLLRQGKKIDAIRVFRMATGAGLKEAKDVVDALEAGLPYSAPQAPAPADPVELRRQVEDLLRRRNKLEAIRAYRQATGKGLKEAKDEVEEIERQIIL